MKRWLLGCILLLCLLLSMACHSPTDEPSPCQTNADCKKSEGQLWSCRAGKCVCEGYTLCKVDDASRGELCVDNATSTKHCGACDRPCKEGQTCCAGDCYDKGITCVETIAGSSESGYRDGTASQALLDAFSGLVYDSKKDTFYIAEFNLLRTLTPDGEVRTIASPKDEREPKGGSGSKALVDHLIEDLALNDQGHIYIAAPHQIRKLIPGGQISTIAGDGTDGSKDGPALKAQFGAHLKLAFGPNNTLYITDDGKLRKLTPDGQVSTVATSISDYITGLAVDAKGNVYYTSSFSIKRLRPADQGDGCEDPEYRDGEYCVSDLGKALFGEKAIQSSSFGGLTLDQKGTLYVTDAGKGLIHVISPDGQISSLGTPFSQGRANGPATQAQFFAPSHVALNAVGHIYVTDYEGTIRRIKRPCRIGWTFCGGECRQFDPLTDPKHCGGCQRACPSGVSCQQGQCQCPEQRLFCKGVCLPKGEACLEELAGSNQPGVRNGPAKEARFSSLSGLAVDQKGNVLIACSPEHTVRQLSPDGQVTIAAGEGSKGDRDGARDYARFDFPVALAVDDTGDVLIIHNGKGMLRRLSPNGIVTTITEHGYAFRDGPGHQAQFNQPLAIARGNTARNGRRTFYIADTGNHKIRKLEPMLQGETCTFADAGTTKTSPMPQDGYCVTTLAGSGKSGAKDGEALDAEFNFPGGLFMDAQGNLFVADSKNNKIRKVSPEGSVTTIAGSDGPGVNEGPARQVKLDINNSRTSMTIDAAGNIYFTAPDEQTIRRLSPKKQGESCPYRVTVDKDRKAVKMPEDGYCLTILVDKIDNVGGLVFRGEKTLIASGRHQLFIVKLPTP